MRKQPRTGTGLKAGKGEVKVKVGYKKRRWAIIKEPGLDRRPLRRRMKITFSKTFNFRTLSGVITISQ